MADLKKINSALISVFHKEGLEEIIAEFIRLGVKIYSTGGTATYIRELGAEVHEVADLTDYPSILGGRVKTLHPKIFGGILARREHAPDQADMAEFEIPYLDAVIVDLYPFEQTVASGADEAAIIEKIDIGGISLIRAGAKNFKDVTIIASQAGYAPFAQILREQNGEISLAQRKAFSAAAFDVSSHYDAKIYRYMQREGGSFKASEQEAAVLRYGENPHQQGIFYGDLSKELTFLNGKTLSYNNLVDIDATLDLVREFDETVFAIIKHTNPCGLATGGNVLEAWTRALECDPLSAFGGILCTNREIDLATAASIDKIFYEVLIAPSYSSAALELLMAKKKRILLQWKDTGGDKNIVKSVLGGYLEQEKDRSVTSPESWEVKTSRQPEKSEIKDIIFGDKVVKHLKSNAIAIVKNGQLIGSGMGQTSRVDALKQALQKASERGFDVRGSVLASDAFFPFSDSAETAFAHGIEVLVEPGGSVKDNDTIEFCESRNMCLLFTSLRHFKH
ncbi:MAG: bifunctional phosphoribosylaminoimidazolecarboxamide formyltransferase/IMP cyclohydrolase [Bacteroidia bacterium]|nr:bifunctional phosphoribosylaminoimidazolecarboxamide formyltransferase/IMP cyclohydrolase [Bacteroidia bacterium]